MNAWVIRYTDTNWCLYSTVLKLVGKHKKNLESEALFLLWKKEIQEAKCGLIMSCDFFSSEWTKPMEEPLAEMRVLPEAPLVSGMPRQGRSERTQAGPSAPGRGGCSTGTQQAPGPGAAEGQGQKQVVFGVPEGCAHSSGAVRGLLCVRSFLRLENNI